MNKNLVVVGGLIVFVLLIVLVSVGVKGQGPEIAVCDKFIKYVQAGNADDSYKLFSSTASSLVSSDGWKVEVANLQTAYGNSKPKETKKTDSLNPGSNAKQSEVDYSLSNNGKTFNLQCNTIQDNKDTLIDSFTSNLAV